MQPEPAGRGQLVDAAHDAVRRFLAGSKTPALLEPGEPQMPLVSDSYEVSYESGRLSIQAWDRDRTIFRRILRILGDKPGELELETERFGKKTGSLKLLDTSSPRTRNATARGERLTYREAFRRSLARQFPGWKISGLSTEPDLEHTLSPAYARALVQKGPRGYAAIGAGPESLDADGALTFGLIWLTYLRQRERKLEIDDLAIFLPEGRERTTCLRARYLNAPIHIYPYQTGGERKLDPADYGNLETSLATCASHLPMMESPAGALIARVLQVPGAEAIECPDGSVSLRVRGMEFARNKDGELRYGLETKRRASPSNFAEVESLAHHLSAMRVPAAGQQSPIYAAHPELWLESQVRRSLQVIDASLAAAPVYGQVPAFAGGERGVIDLLACDVAGRLAVIELKASADVHLPLQALDYWMRVKWHAERSEFGARGYFRGTQLSPRDPKLLLVAPALEFHPSSETILRYFSPEIEVQRIGVGIDWRRELQVVFRLSGSESRA